MRVKELKHIKKYYGERMAHYCRDHFQVILQIPNLFTDIIESTFAHSKFLFDDLIIHNMLSVFEDLVFNQYYNKVGDLQHSYTNKSPEELLKSSGYTLYKCNTHDEVLKFLPYYRDKEALCTFNDPDRVKNRHVFFAVRDDADIVKPSAEPDRQDPYGTSVISIQFTKNKTSRLHICNRYNHSVKNPDATFDNDLDKIVKGLTHAFENRYNCNLFGNDHYKYLFLPNYVLANDGKYYKYNVQYSQCGSAIKLHFCPDNILIYEDGKITEFDKSQYELIDNYLLDKKNLTIKNLSGDVDSFPAGIMDIKKIQIHNIKGKMRRIDLLTEHGYVAITVNQCNNIVGYYNPYVEKINYNFLGLNTQLKWLDLPNVKTIGAKFCYNNKAIKALNLPSVESVGDDFIFSNHSMQEFSAKNLTQVKNNFLHSNRDIKFVDLPNLEYVGSEFLFNNNSVTILNLPKVKEIDNGFMEKNQKIKILDVSTVKSIGNSFLKNNASLTQFYAPELERVGAGFLYFNTSLHQIYANKLTDIGESFCYKNEAMEIIDLPSAVNIQKGFLQNNEQNLKRVNLPVLTKTPIRFLSDSSVEVLLLNSAERLSNGTLEYNKSLTKLIAPNVKIIEDDVLKNNNSLTELDLPNVVEIGVLVLKDNDCIKYFNAPKLKKMAKTAFNNNKKIRENWDKILTKVVRILSFSRKPCGLYFDEKTMQQQDIARQNDQDLTQNSD